MKHTTLTPPLKSLNIAIVSAILGLGAVSTVHAQIQSGTIAALEELEKKAQKIAEQAGNGKITDNDAIKKLLGLSIQGNQISIQDLNTRADINKDNIAKNKADTDASFETLTKNQNALIEQQNALIEQDKAITQELEGFIAYTQAQDQKNFLNQFEIEKNKDAISKNNDSIDDLYEANNENVERIVTIDYAVAANRLNIQELERKQENDIKDVVGMQNAIAEQADINKNDIQDLAKAQLAGVTVMEELNKNVEENKADIANNNTTLAQHTKQINENKQAIEAKLGGKVDAQKLVDLEKKVKKNQDKVDERLATVQENYSQQVQSVDNKIGMVDTRVNALDDKVENSMAAQAALNGLFQPYNVGKVSVSVAVGAYGSKSAIAVGAGYRVNPHLAFKGGAAINTSGSRKGSYNLGINYEF